MGGNWQKCFLLRNSRKGTEENGTVQPVRPASTESVADWTISRPLALLGFESALIALGREIPIGHTSDEGACAKATVFHIRTCESHIHKLLPHGKCDSNPSFPIGISSSPNNKNSQHGFCSIHVIPIDIPMRNAGAGYLRRHNRQSTWIGAKVGLHIPFQITVE